jgi:hypothetical protein
LLAGQTALLGQSPGTQAADSRTLDGNVTKTADQGRLRAADG